MPALNADAQVSLMGGGVKVVGPCSATGASTIFAGSLLFSPAVGTTGLVKVGLPAGADTACRFLGISSKRQYTTAVNQPIEYYVGGVWLFPKFSSAPSAAFLGMYVGFGVAINDTDNPLDMTRLGIFMGGANPAAGDRIVGRVVGFDNLTSLNPIVDLTLGGCSTIITSGALT